MKYLKSIEQLNSLLEQEKAIIVIFVDPKQFMPSESLLKYLFSSNLAKVIDKNIFIWNTVNQQIYEKYQVLSFPQLTILKQKEAVYSFIGYNRQKVNEALQQMCQMLGLGKPTKQLKKALTKCPNNHVMDIVQDHRSSNYVGGCFECDLCHSLSHFEKEKPAIHCQFCSFDICHYCSYEEAIS